MEDQILHGDKLQHLFARCSRQIGSGEIAGHKYEQGHVEGKNPQVQGFHRFMGPDKRFDEIADKYGCNQPKAGID
ncbi:hypothetical protein D3C71_1988800 [compost metagenome]